MKFLSRTFFAALSAFVITGCSPTYLSTGCYQPANAADGCIACVYEDIIFLRVKLPENSDRPNQYLDWAGKYELDKDSGNITLKMPSENWRNWQFYFALRKAGNTLKLDDYSRQQTFTMILDAAAPAATSESNQPLQ